MKHIIYIMLLMITATACNSGSKKSGPEAAVMIGPYNLNKYTKVVLPQQLDEISGIAWDSATSAIVAVNDEDGKLFFLDPETGTIRDKIKFAGNGDYEEVFASGGKWWVLRSDGALLAVTLGDDGTVNTEESTHGIKDDEEEYEAAWCQHNAGNVILIACKKCRDGRLAIKHTATKTNGVTTNEKRLVDFSDAGSGNGKHKFRASAAAYNTREDRIYLLAAPDNKMLIMTPDLKVISIQNLDAAIFKQPEGICFAPDGTMYISNEAAGGNANLLIFKPQNPKPAP